MMNILMICGGGFSSSFLVQNMKKAAQQMGGNITVDARSEAELSGMISTVDIVLITPQLRYNENSIKQICDRAGVPYDLIPPSDFGTMNGEAVLRLALRKIEEFRGAQNK